MKMVRPAKRDANLEILFYLNIFPYIFIPHFVDPILVLVELIKTIFVVPIKRSGSSSIPMAIH
jgi:hypothetical protein